MVVLLFGAGFAQAEVNWTMLLKPDALNTKPLGIDGDNVVGYFADGQVLWHGFLYNKGTDTWRNLDPPDYPNATDVTATGVNGDNVVGYFADPIDPGLYRSFIYSISTETWIYLVYPDAIATKACGVNMDIIVGYYADTSANWHGFVYDKAIGIWMTLDIPGPDPTFLQGIDFSNIVGFTGTGEAKTFCRGAMCAIPDMSPPEPPWPPPGVPTPAVGTVGIAIAMILLSLGFTYYMRRLAKSSSSK
jgi:hypothetical protein